MRQMTGHKAGHKLWLRWWVSLHIFTVWMEKEGAHQKSPAPMKNRDPYIRRKAALKEILEQA